MKRLTPTCRPPDGKPFLVCVGVTGIGAEWFLAKTFYQDCFEGGKTLTHVEYFDQRNKYYISISMTGSKRDAILGWAELPSTNFEEE